MIFIPFNHLLSINIQIMPIAKIKIIAYFSKLILIFKSVKITKKNNAKNNEGYI